jgi:histidyl-tRNA synthetase
MAKKKGKPQKVKPRLPRGFVDRSAHDIRATDAMVSKIREVYELYGFDPVETPQFEYTDALGKFLPDSDRPNEGVFSLQDDDEQWLSLRYDLTAPLARHVAENFNEISMPYRTYRSGWVFRNEKPGPGRFRQFMQFDADSVGAPGVQADAEMCMMMADTMEKLGIKRGDYLVRVNNRKVLDGIMAKAGIDGDEHAGTRLTVLRAIDKLDRLGIEGVRLLLGEGRKDDSGDFTKGAGLDVASADIILQFVQSAGDDVQATLDILRELVVGNQRGEDGVEELSTMAALFAAGGYEKNRIFIDPSVVRGLEYYTGPVYEVELTFDVTNEKGEKVQFGSVGGGGRYDGLVSRFRGEPVPATGFSIGVSRLMTALKNLGKLDDVDALPPVMVCVMDRDIAALGEYQAMVKELREAGIRAEMYQGNPKNFGKQLQYADRRGCGIAIIQGSDERSQNQVQVKDLIEGKRLSQEISDNETWRKIRPAQQMIERGELIAKVREILTEQQEEAAAELAAK